MSQRAAVLALLIALASVAPACGQNVGRAAVTLRLQAPKGSPRDATVIIDEEYVGPLWLVVARGVRLPVGEHRVTVEREGFFPWDKLVVADRQPITLDVRLEPIPD